MYYLRSKAASDAIQFTVIQKGSETKEAAPTESSASLHEEDSRSPKRRKQENHEEEEAIACSLLNRDQCVSCGS